jgi:site-specific DNA-methyltransferase (adenine-specific)
MIRVFKNERTGIEATLYLGDCAIIAPSIQGVSAVVSDPPYGMNWDTDSSRFSGGNSESMEKNPRGTGRSDYGPVAGDSVEFDASPWIKYPKCVLFGVNHFGNQLPVGTTLVWVKKHEHLWGSFLSDAEAAWMKGGFGVYLYKKSFPPPVRAMDAGGNPANPIGIHPTQKPVSLMAWCMDRAKVERGETAMDPFMGSGTTGVACIRTGRNFIGIEKDPKHFQTACDRISREFEPTLL